PEKTSAALEKARGAREGRIESMLAQEIGFWPAPWWDVVHGELLYREAYALIHRSPLPEDARLLVLRGRGLRAIGRSDEAQATFARAFALQPDDLLIRIRALPHVSRADEFAHGLTELRAFLKEHPEQPEDSRLALASAHLQWGSQHWNGSRRAEAETA